MRHNKIVSILARFPILPKVSKGSSFILLMLVLLNSLSVYAVSTSKVVVYGRECSSCFLNYVEKLENALEEIGITEVESYFIEEDPEARKALENLHRKLRVPEDMRGQVVVSIDDKFLFEESVPVKIIMDFLVNHKHEHKNLIVYKDSLKQVYRILDEKGRISECKTDTSISECVKVKKGLFDSVLLLVVLSGLLDGINPCAFSVLLFFIAFLFTAASTLSPHQIKRKVLITGSTYILAVYLAYLMIGFTFINIIALTRYAHLVPKIGALIMIILGFINIKDYFFPGRGISLGIPKSQWERIREWMRKFTLPATFAMGIMVGLLELPCTGGVYLAILALLYLRFTFHKGLAFLILYNLAFIAPLIVILAVATNQRTMSFSLEKWKRQKHRKIKLLSGIIIVILGVYLLISGSI